MENHFETYPTVDEVRALELAAQQARSLELLRLIRAGAAGVKALIGRVSSAVHAGGRIGHA
jgi:hypothetical protein